MAKEKKGSSSTIVSKKKADQTTNSGKGPLEQLDSWFEKHDKKVFYSLLFFSTLFSLLLFDSKVSDGGDDSSYIERAWLLLNEGKLTYFQGPGYPIFLSLFVKLFGLNVIKLKLSSVLCQIGFVSFTYAAFRKRIPYLALFALLSFISFNHFIQYYASQTFTETFFLFVQSICLYIVFKIIDAINSGEGFTEGIKKNYLKWILFGLLFVLLSISKSVSFVGFAWVLLYFALNKNYKEIVYAIIAFALIRIIYQLITSSIYGPPDYNQLELVLRKDLYKPALGQEDLSGLIKRFFSNFNTFISLHMYRLMNLRSSNALTIIPPLAYITGIIIFICSFLSYKRNKFVFFSSIYIITLCGGVFIGIQAANMQDRLIIIAIPLLFLVLFYGVSEMVKRSSSAQYILLFFSCFMLLTSIGKSVIKAKQTTVALKKNLSGDIYYGYTPDWESYLKMSKYCADSLPDSSHVLSRKPNMSFIYGDGKKFAGQYWVTTTNPDSVLMGWQQQKIKYVLVGSLRMNPKKNNGRIINTIHRMLQPVAQKYPEKLKLLKTIGTDEPTYLYEINY